jgi:hypothetical protein
MKTYFINSDIDNNKHLIKQDFHNLIILLAVVRINNYENTHELLLYTP